jgi:hypothetical protein
MLARADVQSPACLTDPDAWQLADPTTATTRPAASHARQRRHHGAPFVVGSRGAGNDEDGLESGPRDRGP